MALLLQIHSHTRWLILLIGIAALVKFLIGWLNKGSFQKVDRILISAFSGLLDLQATLGLIILLWNGLVDGAGFPRYRLEHLGAMILAVVLGHLQARWKNSPDAIRFRNTAFIIVGVFVLIYLGVLVLPGGWTR
jgi:hypothetical protein